MEHLSQVKKNHEELSIETTPYFIRSKSLHNVIQSSMMKFLLIIHSPQIEDS